MQRLLFISNLYPNSREPYRGLFNMHLLHALRALGHPIEVIAPVAYFPGRDHPPPRTETWEGITVHHPRYFYTPGFWIQHHWRSYRHAVTPLLRQRLATPNQEPPQKSLQSSLPHAILGFLYPDAVAMAEVCRALGIPYSVLSLGSDFRIRMQQPHFRPLVLDCLQRAPRIFCPGQALRNDIRQAGISGDKITHFDNGIDPANFYADDTPRRNEILFVGNLVGVKAPERLLAAFGALTDLRSGGLRLVMVGSGPLRDALERQAAGLGIGPDQIEWVGSLPQAEVARRMRQARVLCLCSRSEGMPNVVVEALACGCPVVATAVGEIPYMLHAGNGCILPPQTDDATLIPALTDALRQALGTPYDHAAIAAATTPYRWEHAARRLSARIHGASET